MDYFFLRRWKTYTSRFLLFLFQHEDRKQSQAKYTGILQSVCCWLPEMMQTEPGRRPKTGEESGQREERGR